MRLVTFFDLQRSRIRLPLFVLIAVSALGGAMSLAGPLGFRVDWNIPFQPDALHNMFRGTDGFTAWNYANGGTALFYPTLAPYLLLVSALSYIVPAAGVLERLLIIVALTAAAEGMFRVCRMVLGGAAVPGSVAAAVSYVIGTFIFTKLSQGVVQEAVSYAVLPFVLVAFIVASQHRTRLGSVAYSALTGVLISACAVQTQYGLLALAVVFAYAVWRHSWLPFMLCVVFAAASSAYAAIPLVFSLHNATSQFAMQTPFEEVVRWAPTIDQAIRQAGYAGSFAESAVTATGTFDLWTSCGFALFAMALVGLAATRRAAGIAVAAMLVIVTLLSALPKIDADAFEFILKHVPAMFVFRESYRFEALVAFLEAIGVGFFVDYVLQLDRRQALAWLGVLVASILAIGLRAAPAGPAVDVAVLVVGGALVLESSRKPALQTVASVAAVFLIVIGASPFLGAGYRSQVQSFVPPRSAYDAYKWLESTHADARVLYLPFLIPMHPHDSPFDGVDPTISWSPLESFGNYLPLRISKQFASALYASDQSQTAMLANWLGISYLDYRKWIDDEFYASVPATRTGRFTGDAFSKASALAAARRIGFRHVQGATHDSDEQVWRRASLPMNYVAGVDRLKVVDGDLATATADYDPGDVDVFVNQNAGADLMQALHAGARLVVSGGIPYGFVLSFIDKQYVENGAVNATHLDADQGWGGQGAWNSWWWLDHGYMSATEDVAVVARVNAHTLSFPSLHVSGPAMVLVKYFVGPNSTWLTVGLGAHHWALRSYAPAQNAGFRWFAARADADSGDSLSVTNAADGDGAVARAAVVPLSDFTHAQKLAYGALATAHTAYVLSASGPMYVAAAGSYTVRVRCATPWLSVDGREVILQRSNATYVAKVALSRGMHEWKASARGCGAMVEPASWKMTSSAPAAFARTGATSYQAAASSPGVAVLSTGFSPLWSLRGGKSTHLTVNGYANGWLYFPKGRSSQIQLICRSVVFLRVGIVLSLLALLVTAALLFVIRRMDRSCQGLASAYQTATMGDS